MTVSTIQSNYAPSEFLPMTSAEEEAQRASERNRAIFEALQGLVQLLTEKGQGTPVSIGAASANLAAALTNDPVAQKVAAVGSGVNGVVSALNSTTLVPVASGTPGAMQQVPTAGRVFNAAGAGIGAVGQLTGSTEVATVGQAATGVGDTMRAAQVAGFGGGITTGLGAGLGLAGRFIKGTAGKVVNAGSIALNTAGGILSKATSLGGGIVSGVAGMAGLLIGGETGRKISALGSIAAGALVTAANPILGAITILGGLFGLFGGKKKNLSKYSEQMAADFRGDGKADDVMVRAPKGLANALEINLADPKTGKKSVSQTLLIGGKFDDKNQSRQAQTVDLNGDGKSDIVWQDKNRVSVFMNQGNGKFGNAEYGKQRTAIAADARALREWGEVVDVLTPRQASRGRGGERDDDPPELVKWQAKWAASRGLHGALSPRDSAVLKRAWTKGGGAAKLGDFGGWAHKVKSEASLDVLRAQYTSGGGRARLGTFADFVAARLERLGIAKPKHLSDALSSALMGGAPAPQPWAGIKSLGGKGGVRGLLASSFSHARSAGPHWTTYGNRARGRVDSATRSPLLAVIDSINRQRLGAFDAGYNGVRKNSPLARVGDGLRGDVFNDKFTRLSGIPNQNDGSGVSLRTQTLDVEVDKQMPGQVLFWDVNGDGATDMVFAGDGVKKPKAFINKGNGVFDTAGIDMSAPTEKDWGKLVLQDRQGRQFLNVDFRGDGKDRMQAVFDGQQWRRLAAQTEKT
jgi:hypothetical protein